MPDPLIRASDAWRKIRAAVDGDSAGEFVPVLGPGVSSTGTIGSLQEIERNRVRHILALLATADELTAREREYMAQLARQTDASAAKAYASSTQSYASVHPFRDDDEHARYRAFQLALVRLAARLTQVWARSLYYQPDPLSTDESCVITDELVVETELIEPFRSVLTLAADLYAPGYASRDLDLEPDPANDPAYLVGGIRVGLMRPRLLRLLAEIVGVQVLALWSEFLAQAGHESLIRDWDALCGFSFGDDGQLEAKAGRRVIAARQILWLEGLIRHTALVQTVAYMDSREMAFELSLFKSGEVELADSDFELDIPRLHELGFVYSKHEYAQSEVIQSIMQRSSRASATSGPRQASPFHLSIAGLVGEAQAAADLPTPVLSSCWDLEMPNAFAAIGQPFYMLLPVWLPRVQQRSRRAGTNSKPSGGSGSSGPVASWLFGEFCGVEDGRPQLAEGGLGWQLVHAGDISEHISNKPWEGREPVLPMLVCLAGSPLIDLPAWSELPSAQVDVLGAKGYDVPNATAGANGRGMAHRPILDESDLLVYIDGPVPKEAANLLNEKQLFFFGHPASSSSSRIHYYALSRRSADLDASTDGEAETDAQSTDGEERSPELAKNYSLERAPLLGQLALEKWHVGSATFSLQTVMNKVIKECGNSVRGGQR